PVSDRTAVCPPRKPPEVAARSHRTTHHPTDSVAPLEEGFRRRAVVQVKSVLPSTSGIACCPCASCSTKVPMSSNIARPCHQAHVQGRGGGDRPLQRRASIHRLPQQLLVQA